MSMSADVSNAECPFDMSAVDILKAIQQGTGRTGTVRMPMEVHIGAIKRIRLNPLNLLSFVSDYLILFFCTYSLTIYHLWH